MASGEGGDMRLGYLAGILICAIMASTADVHCLAQRESKSTAGEIGLHMNTDLGISPVTGRRIGKRYIFAGRYVKPVTERVRTVECSVYPKEIRPATVVVFRGEHVRL